MIGGVGFGGKPLEVRLDIQGLFPTASTTGFGSFEGLANCVAEPEALFVNASVCQCCQYLRCRSGSSPTLLLVRRAAVASR